MQQWQHFAEFLESTLKASRILGVHRDALHRLDKGYVEVVKIMYLTHFHIGSPFLLKVRNESTAV